MGWRIIDCEKTNTVTYNRAKTAKNEEEESQSRRTDRQTEYDVLVLTASNLIPN